MTDMASTIRFLSIPGLVPWEKAHDFQLRTLQERIDDRAPDTVIFLEHSAVITRGRGLQRPKESLETDNSLRRHAPLDPSRLPLGTDLIETERGGDLTWHGPGQLVIYPIIKLDGQGLGPDHDIENYIRRLERAVIRSLYHYGLTGACSIPDSTGVWIKDSQGTKKIASIGIAVRKWVAYHGIGLNISSDLSAFRLFEPCGFSSDVMTRLTDWVQTAQTPQHLRDEMEELISKQMIEMGNYKTIVWDHTSI